MIPLALNSRGEEVAKLQLLLDHYLPPGRQLKPDGVFGIHTRDGVIAFQKKMNLPADGVVGPQTRRALGLPDQVLTFPPAIPPALVRLAPWMAIAAAEFGVHRDMKLHHEKRIIEYLKTTTVPANMANTDSTPWCSAFVNWVIIKSGRKGTNNAGAASWLAWKYGRSLSDPSAGAIVVIRKRGASSDHFTGSGTGNHVGFCMEFSSVHVRLLGGNQGNRVSFANFSLTGWELRGAMWPSP
jgi:uncharacterized protein (TIGR02594 family)